MNRVLHDMRASTSKSELNLGHPQRPPHRVHPQSRHERRERPPQHLLRRVHRRAARDERTRHGARRQPRDEIRAQVPEPSVRPRARETRPDLRHHGRAQHRLVWHAPRERQADAHHGARAYAERPGRDAHCAAQTDVVRNLLDGGHRRSPASGDVGSSVRPLGLLDGTLDGTPDDGFERDDRRERQQRGREDEALRALAHRVR
mmetsp:Transcript_1765/g.7827  ORF Transcript_1765/g.7827 Transcript_1765/m.7827 type:complete len:203 (+) Transcript_1765:2-610(+)